MVHPGSACSHCPGCGHITCEDVIPDNRAQSRMSANLENRATSRAGLGSRSGSAMNAAAPGLQSEKLAEFINRQSSAHSHLGDKMTTNRRQEPTSSDLMYPGKLLNKRDRALSRLQEEYEDETRNKREEHPVSQWRFPKMSDQMPTTHEPGLGQQMQPGQGQYMQPMMNYPFAWPPQQFGGFPPPGDGNHIADGRPGSQFIPYPVYVPYPANGDFNSFPLGAWGVPGGPNGAANQWNPSKSWSGGMYQQEADDMDEVDGVLETSRGPPLFRTGHGGSTWRHVNKVISNQGQHLVYLDGTTRIHDSMNYPPYGYHAKPRGRLLNKSKLPQSEVALRNARHWKYPKSGMND